jgi:hypothetical protein
VYYKDQEIKDNLEESVNVLRKALKEDEELYYGYQANIAMAFVDEVGSSDLVIDHNDLHEIANTSAINFLNTLIGDTR